TDRCDPFGSNLHMNYQTGREISSITDPTGLMWQFIYGGGTTPPSRLTSIVDPGNAVRMTAAYNTYGQPTSVTVPAAVAASGQDETASVAYTNIGDVSWIMNPLGDILSV